MDTGISSYRRFLEGDDAGLERIIELYSDGLMLFIYELVRDIHAAEDLMEDAKAVLNETMEYCMDRNITDWGKIKTEIKDALGEFVWRETKRRPMIMPIIMEV